jgi:hypothetical protein
LPPEIVEKAKKNPFMRDILTEASPFDINSEGEILYSRVFKNPEKLRP